MNDNIEYRSELAAMAERLGYKIEVIDGDTIKVLGNVSATHQEILEELRTIGCRIQFETSQGLITAP